MTDEPMPSIHLQPTELAAWLTSGPTSPAARRVSAHLAACDECRGEAIEVARLLRPGTTGRRRVLHWAAAALATAAVAALAIRVGPGGPSRPAEAIRSAPPAQALVPVAPLGPVSLATGPVRFIWHAPAGAVEYRVTLLDGRGAVVWTQATTDTVVVLPITISLGRATSYYWYVDALQSNGESTSSGSQEFRLIP